MKTSVIEEDIDTIISDFKQDLQKLSGKTVLITGGTGLIASYMVDVIAKFNQQLQEPCKIIAINKNSVNENSRLSHLISDPNVSFITADIGKKFDIPGKPNIIIHAASRANPSSFLADPIDTLDANVNGTRTLLEYAKDHKVENFLFFSSAEVYGNPIEGFIPTPETYTGNIDCLNHWACYTESKRFSETLCANFFRKFNVPVKMLRILLAYGPGMRNDGKVISDFFHAAMNKREIPIRDKGEARRSFCYVSDVVSAIFRIMFSGTSGEAYNIGNDKPEENLSILQIAQNIAATFGPDVQVKPNMDAPKKIIYGIDNRRLNIDKLRKIGFEPKTPIAVGLQRTKRYYEESSLLTTLVSN